MLWTKNGILYINGHPSFPISYIWIFSFQVFWSNTHLGTCRENGSSPRMLTRPWSTCPLGTCSDVRGLLRRPTCGAATACVNTEGAPPRALSRLGRQRGRRRQLQILGCGQDSSARRATPRIKLVWDFLPKRLRCRFAVSRNPEWTCEEAEPPGMTVPLPPPPHSSCGTSFGTAVASVRKRGISCFADEPSTQKQKAVHQS